MFSSYDEWKTTEPTDPYAEELELLEREAEEDRDQHPERYEDDETDFETDYEVSPDYCGEE